VTKLRLVLTERDRAPCVVCTGTIDKTTCRALEGVVEGLLEQEPRSVTVDCRTIVAVDVSGTGALLRVAGRCYEHGVSVDVLPSAATGDMTTLVWPFAIGARSFGRTPPGYTPRP
jgi:ABC-type transporter Mla MlaB component